MAGVPNFALRQVFDWPSFCASQQLEDADSKRSLAGASRQFLLDLALSKIHPTCTSGNFASDAPPMGPLTNHDYHEGFFDLLVTMWLQSTATFFAMAELWFRLFCMVIAPLGCAYLIQDLFTPVDSKQNKNRTTWVTVGCIASITASLVLTTDSLYVYQLGERYGTSHLAATSILATTACLRHKLSKVFLVVVLLWGLTFRLAWDQESHSILLGGQDMPRTVDEGIYFHAENTLVRTILQHWDVPTYSVKTGACPWMPTGDSRTGIPFLIHSANDLNLERLWLPTLDGEAVRLEVSFPKQGHSTTKPLYLVLHGLSGGSQESFVKDFAHRRNDEGSTVVIMIARGLMDTPVKSFDVFHGARIDDVSEAAKALRRTLKGDQTLAGVGFSMGAIILTNYVARSGPDCALDVGMAISGGLDMRYQLYHHRAKRLWEPMLALTLRDQFIIGKLGDRYSARLTRQQMLELMRATDVSTVDEHAVVTYNGYDNILHYYSEMSAMGDLPMGEIISGDMGRINNVSIPFCLLNALDDPLVTWKTVAENKGPRHPSNLVKTGTGNLIMLLTKGGGHVGWPLGWNPANEGWRWMNDAAGSFVTAYVNAKTEMLAGLGDVTNQSGITSL